ncbi:MAG: alpha/beta fold hydrolase [Cyanobacteria bacterium J06642_2]
MLSNQPFTLTGESDRACLLLHGLGGGAYEMQDLGVHLHQQGWTVRCPLYPGHDRPLPAMPDSTWQQWYECALNEYRQLAEDYERIAVVGFSTGCLLGLHLAASQPISKLILLAPYLLLRRQWYYLIPLEVYLFSIGRFIKDLPRLRLPIRDREMERAAREVVFFQTFNLNAVRSASELIEIVKQELPEIQVPTAIVQSRADTVVDPSGAEYLQQVMGARVQKLQWLEDSDHIITLDGDREQVFGEVSAFLAHEH